MARTPEVRQSGNETPKSGSNLPNIDDNFSITEINTFLNEVLPKEAKISASRLQQVKDKFLECALKIAKQDGQINELRKENLRLQQQVLDISKEHSSLLKPTYASVAAVAAPKPSHEQHIEQVAANKNHVVFITSKTNEQPRSLQEKLRKIINPIEDRIKIKNIKTTPRSVIIETDTEEDIKKIQKKTENNAEIKVELPKKKRPLLILYDVPTTLTSEEITNLAYHQNFYEEMNLEQFKTKFLPRFKTGPKEKATVNHVVEVDPTLRRQILQKRYLYLSYTATTPKDFLTIARCARCQDLGHVAKFCRQEKSTCGHCGEEDHMKANCAKINQAPVCIPCKLRGKCCNQQNSKDCPTYRMLLNRHIQRIDYG